MIPIQITMKDVQNSFAIEQQIRNRYRKIFQQFKQITACHVVVEAPQKHGVKGIYNIRIMVNLPGKEIMVNRKPHKDLYLGIRDSFIALKRQLTSHFSHKQKLSLVNLKSIQLPEVHA